MSASTKLKAPIFLDSPLRYPNWIYIIEQKTNDLGIWPMIDPNWTPSETTPTQPQHEEPEPPHPSEVSRNASTLADISSVQERWVWENLNVIYARTLKAYEKKDKAMMEIKEYILSTISEVYMVHIRHLSTP
jgi:hypothetical protein